MFYKNKLNKNEQLLIAIMQNMTHLFYEIVKTTITKLICIKLINSRYKHKSKDNVNLKKTSTIYNTNKLFRMIAKLNIIFIISSEKNGKRKLI